MLILSQPRTQVAVRAIVGIGILSLSWVGSAVAQVTAEQSAKMLKPAEGLEAKLWASEPMVVNPTTMDIDSRGRVWITEGLNYRLSRGGNRQFKRNEEADKIKILEDTDGDGKADKMTVFADKVFPVPMGLALEEKWSKDGKYLGNSPDILVLEDTDGDDKADKRYPLLTGFGGIDSDHGVHGMVLGIDGKLYFTHGDGCCSVQQDKSERVQNFDVVDKSGRHVSSDQLANTLRVNRDGTQFEILADRQRNNYETALNAFGNIFTSDNDDDGNRGSRVIWVMEGGHYGYRTPGSARHWGEDTPGPIPKLVGTGNGSPCGLAVYEGNLLPKEFQGALLEAEAGPRVINYFPVERHKAEFRTEHKVLLASDDQWFRPVDVTVAPDGAVFVADWYDGGVGGHAFRDQTTGRIYRVAPTGNKPASVKSPLADSKADEQKIHDLANALGSANVATRFAAREVLIALAADKALTENVLGNLLSQYMLGGRVSTGAGGTHVASPQTKWAAARACFVLHAIQGDNAIYPMLKSSDPAVRELAVRILGRDVSRNGNVTLSKDEVNKPLRGEANFVHLAPLANDPDPGVRRELILALQDVPTKVAGDALITLASLWDGQDRWYLEALGLALDGREPEMMIRLFDGNLYGDLNLSETGKDGSIAVPPYFPADRNEAYIKTGTPDLSSNALGKTLGLAWRLHRAEALRLIGRILPSLEAAELKQAADDVLKQFTDKSAAIVLAELISQATDPTRKGQLLATLSRKIGGDWKDARSSKEVVDVIEAALKDPAQRVAGITAAAATRDSRYGSTLMAFVNDSKVDNDSRVAAVEAVGQIKPPKTAEFLDGLILSAKGKGTSNPLADAALRTLPSVRDAAATLTSIITAKDYPVGLRREALRTYGRLNNGGLKVIALAREGKLPEDLKTEATTLVHRDTDRRVREEAAQVLPLPKMANGRSVPPIFMLVRAEGNAEKGRQVFFRSGANACASCHRVQGQGNWIGPDLSTIGAKDGKAELIQSILNPSAAIGYNFRSQVIALNDGRVVTGLLVEEAPDRLVIKTAEGQRVNVPTNAIEDRKQSEVSLMPEGLAQTMSDQDLIDLLTFLTTLRQPVSIVGKYLVAPKVVPSDAAAAFNYHPINADAEGQVSLKTIAGDDKDRVGYLVVNPVAGETTKAKLVVDTKAKVVATLNGKPVELKSENGGPNSGEITLNKGENHLVLMVHGGAEGGLVTTIVAPKAIDFR